MAQNVNILWQKCAIILKDNLTQTVYNTWFAPLEAVSFSDGVLVLRVKSQYVVEYIEENYLELRARTSHRVFGDGTRLEYRVLIDSTSGAGATYPSKQQVANAQSHAAMQMPDREQWDSQLNPSCTFDSFIAGESNRMARTAGLAIAKEPGKTIFNPVFIYGSSGVGKTHLANAIGNAVVQSNPDARVLYVGANTFKMQYQEAVQRNKVPEFLVFYQSVDVLIVDDIQFFCGLGGTQSTFFHIFNYLHQCRKQLILTSDRPPLQLSDLEERLLTRFKWGLSIEIQRPDIALRRAILVDKMHRNGVTLSDEIIDYIAENACQNVRDIEGVLASLMAYSTFMNKDVDMLLAKSVVARLVETFPREIAMGDIVGAVCDHSGITEKAIVGQSRQKEIVRARQMVIYLTKKLTESSYSDIGHALGNRSHATIIHAWNAVSDQLTFDRVLKHDVDLIERELKR